MHIVAASRPPARFVVCKSQQYPTMAHSAAPQVVVRPVTTHQELQQFRCITRAYLEWLGEDLSFQQIESELTSLPGSYATETRGAMLLAYDISSPPSSGQAAAAAATAAADGIAADPTAASAAAGGSGGGGSISSGSGSNMECIGAVALRPLAGHTNTLPAGSSLAGVPLSDVCEMKRLFVLPGHHGLGAGAALVRALLPTAVQLGYRLMVLDTLDRLEGANKLYRRLGFQACERYNDCPLPGVLYFARQLGGAAEGHSSRDGSRDGSNANSGSGSVS